jgi:zinc transport system substrate-binding protein
VELEYLLPLGTSAHAYDPTPSDIIKIMDSDLFIYTGSVMEPWIDSDVLPNVTSDFNGLDLSEHVSLMADTHDQEEDHDEGEYDPHYWTLPSNAKGMINAIRDELIELLPEKENEIRENADNYLVELDGLDAKWHNLVEYSSQLTIIYGGHFAFGYVGEYYGFETLSPYEGYTPNAEQVLKI